MIWLLTFLLVALVRLVGIIRNGQEQTPAESFVLLWSMLVLATSLFGVGALAGVWWCVPCVLAGMVLLAPWAVTRHVLIPLGMPRAACRLAVLAGWTWKRDCQGGGLVAGAWAIARQRTPDRGAMDWLAARRDRQQSFQAAHVLATGLLAAARGDLSGARRLLESVGEVGPQRTPRMVHALAREWLVADAAAQGDWPRVVRLGRSARAPTRTTTRSTRLLARAGARLAHVSPVPAAWSVWLSWAVAPHRRHTLALARQAVRTTPAPATRGATAAQALSTALQPDPCSDALSTHVAVLRGQLGPSPAQALQSLAQAWDRALIDPETLRAIRQRAIALGARGGEAALAALGDTVARDLADMARAHDLPIATWPCDSHTLREAERLLREQLIGEVELAFDALRDRVAQGRRLPAIDEWREWLSLRGLHARAAGLGGLELRRLTFPHVHAVGCKMAVWLWNERGQHFLANAMFRWLLDEAVAVGDAEAIELQRRNWDDSY
jgi:hypothetical protein